MSCVVRGDAGVDEDLLVLVACDLGILRGEFDEDLLASFLSVGIGLLRFVASHLGRCLVAFASRRKKNDRRQEIVTTQRRDELMRWNFRRTRVHGKSIT